MRSISQRELRVSSGQVLRDPAAGEELMVARDGEPLGVLRMDPPPTERRRFVSPEQYAAVRGDVPTLTASQQQAWLGDIRRDRESGDPWASA